MSGIRQIAASWSGPIIAAAEFQRRVETWDLDRGERIAAFDTTVEFSGRLAISADGTRIVISAYERNGLACYSATDGTELWRRKDLKKVQVLRFSRDDRLVLCAPAPQPYQVLDRNTGETVYTIPRVRKTWESAFEAFCVHEKQNLIAMTSAGKRLVTIKPEREEYAFTGVAFGPAHLCVSEVGGDLRCFHLPDGGLRWRYHAEYPKRGLVYVLWVCYAECEGCFVGVLMKDLKDKHGITYALLKFAPSPEQPQVLVDPLAGAYATAFAKRGSRLITSTGEVLDTATGERVLTLWS